tara:strand:- start:1227 stop:2723 length:1497 start_codon:yes stop_codon:yes gene_type:complete
MAFLGGLFGDYKTKDVVTGAATAVTREIKDSMDKTDDNISRLSQLRLERVMRDQQKHDTDLAANLEIIKNMEGMVGDADAVGYLIQEHGFAEAQNIAAELNRRKKASGGRIKPSEILGIEKSTGGAVNAMTLANYVTPSKSIASASEFGDAGIGIASSLFGYGKDEFKKRSDADIAAAGYADKIGKTSLTDLPTIKGKDLYEWQIYTSDNPARQAANLTTIISDLSKQLPTASSSEKEVIQDELTAATAERSLLELEYEYQKSLEMKGKLKPMKAIEVQRYANTIDGIVATHYGLAKPDSWTYDEDLKQRVFNYKGMTALVEKEVKAASASMLRELDKAHIAGMPASEIRYYVSRAVKNNQVLNFVPADGMDDDPTFELVPDSTLLNTDLTDANGQRVFTGLSSDTAAAAPGAGDATGGSSLSPAASSAAATATVNNPTAAAAQDIANSKQAYQNNNNPTDKKQMVASLLRKLNAMDYKNPATNKEYTDTELEAELSK